MRRRWQRFSRAVALWSVTRAFLRELRSLFLIDVDAILSRSSASLAAAADGSDRGNHLFACGCLGDCVRCISDLLIRGGASQTVVRKAAFAIGAVGAGTGLIGCGFSAGIGSEVWLAFAGFSGGILGANTFVVAQMMAGPLATGRWVGIQNTLGNIAGLVAPSLTGILVERTGSFTTAFAVAGVMAFCSGVAWVFLTGPIARIDWTRKATLAPAFGVEL